MGIRAIVDAHFLHKSDGKCLGTLYPLPPMRGAERAVFFSVGKKKTGDFLPLFSSKEGEKIGGMGGEKRR